MFDRAFYFLQFKISAKNGGTNVRAAFGTRITRTNEWYDLLNLCK